MLRPAVFLDRDSTLNQRVYDGAQRALASPLQVEQAALRRDAAAFIRGLNRMGYLCLVLTAQPELATRRLTVVRLERIHQKLREDLARNGAHVDGIFYSDEHPALGRLWSVGSDGGNGGDARGDDGGDHGGSDGGSDGSRTDKSEQPVRGLLIEAASVHQVDVRRSFVVSEEIADMANGRAAGAETILLLAGEDMPQEFAKAVGARPDHIAKNLPAALRIIESSREAARR